MLGFRCPAAGVEVQTHDIGPETLTLEAKDPKP